MEKFCFLFWLSLSCLAYSETRYVVKDNPKAAAPYTNWLHAAATIQDAVDVSVSNDTIWVTNGVYETGGRTANGALTNRVAITNAGHRAQCQRPGGYHHQRRRASGRCGDPVRVFGSKCGLDRIHADQRPYPF